VSRLSEIAGYVVGFAISFSPTALALLASAWLSKRSVEEWQLLAWVPPLPLVIWWIYFLIAAIRDPTSHNLWPLEMILWLALSLVLFVAFIVGRRLSGSSNRLSRWRH
jgi:hypothetical protein